MSSIRPVGLDEILGLERYEAEREAIRRRVIELKRHRRISVGDEITLVFENHDTVFFQIQEMLRAEHITDLDAIRAEMSVYNESLPRPGELSATLLIEITDQENIPARLMRLIGIDEALRLEIGDRHVVRAAFEPGRSEADRLSAVQYVRFALPPAARAEFADPAILARLVVDHPNYKATAVIEGEIRRSLIDDLEPVR